METSVSIIIPAWNEEKIILKTSNFLRKLKLPFKYSEIIFIAGGTDDTYNICNEIKLDNFDNVITHRQNPRDFKSGALIKGIKKSTGDYIILIDADVFVAPNLAIEVARALKKFDVVCCDFIPMMQKGFWYNYYTMFKLLWAKNPSNLSSLIGGATISVKREVINEIGVENFFSHKTTAGVDYYMGLVLKKEKKRIGFVKKARVIMPRPNNLKDFYKDQKRWLTAFLTLHQEEKWLIFTNLILNISICLFPLLLFLSNIKKLKKISKKKSLKIKNFFTLYFVEFIINFLSIVIIIKKMTGKLKNVGHFKGEDRYLS